MKKILVLWLAMCGAAFAQNAISNHIVNSNGTPVASASVRICLATAAGVPCVPTVSLYSDYGLTQAISNPTLTDVNGNFTVYSLYANAPYMVQVYFPGSVVPNYAYATGSSDASAATWGLSGTSAYYTQGSVGIGTTTPVAALDVVAPYVNYAPSTTYGAASSFLFNAAGVDLAAGVAPTAPYAYWLQTRNTNSGAQSFAINPVGGGVGIGTLSPIGTFNVVPSLTLNPATAGQIILGGNTGQLQNAAGTFNQGGNQIIIQGSSYTNAFNGHGANSVLVSGGNIAAAAGIGAADIAGGNVTISGGSSTGVTGSTAIGGAVVVQGGLATAGGANLIGPVTLQASGGNVGVGTTSPGAKLEVNGSLKLTYGSGGAITFADGTSQYTASSGGGSGTVTNVSAPPLYTVSNPTTTPTFTLNSQAANTVLAAPNGSSGPPSARLLVPADLPTGIPVANLSSTTTTINGVPCTLGGANCVTSSSSSPFSAITSGTNTGQLMVVGSGSILDTSAGGYIGASTVPASGTDPYAFAVETGDTSVNGKVACTASPFNIQALTDNLHIAFTPSTGPNTSATPSMNLCGLGAVTITGIGDQPLQPGDLTATYPDGSPTLLQIVYNSASNHWELQNPQTGWAVAQKCSGAQMTPVANVFCVDNFPQSGGTITATNSTNMVIVPASGTTLSILGSPGFDLQFSAGKYALPAGTTNISGGGTFTIASGTTIQSISYNYYTGTGTITINNAATKTGSGTGNATVAVTPGIYNGTYTTAWDYACAEAGLYNVTSSHHVSLVLGGGSHSANQPCVILGTSSGTGVSVYGQGPGGIITRPMAFALPQYGASSSQFGSIVKANWAIGAYSYPIMLYASNPGGRYQFTQRGVGFDNTGGSAHGCEEMDGVVSVMMEDVRCSDESSGNWPSFGFGNAQIYNSNGYSGDFKWIGLDFTRLSTNSSTSFSENSQVQVNITSGSVSSTSIVAGGTVTSDDQLVPIVYNAYSQCSVNPTFAITVTGGISFGQPHAGAAGTGYVVGDVVTLVQSGSSGTGKLTVSAIGTGGSVLAFNANSTSSSNFGSGYTGTSFTANTVGTPLATTGGSGTGLMVDAQAYGALTGITTLTAGSGCVNTLTGSSTGVIYAQVMRPSLTGGTYTPTQGAAGMDLNSTSDSHGYAIQGQIDGNVGFRNNNHGGNKFYSMHMIGVGGAGGGFDDEWGGQQCYECSADTISWIPFTINPNVAYNQDNFYSPTILFNAVWAPFSGAIGWYIGDTVHTVLTIRDETCGTNGEQTAGGYIQYMGPTGAAVTPGTIPGFMPSNSQECGGSVPLVTDTWFNQNVSLYGSTNGTYNSFTLGPANPATSVTPGQNSDGLGMVDSQWNSGTSKAVGSNWLQHLFANGAIDEMRLDYTGGGLIDNPSGGVSAVGMTFNNASLLATSSLNVPGLYFGSEGQAWNGTSSQACRFLFMQKMTVSGTPTAAGLQLYPNCPLSSGGQFFADFTTYNIALETNTLVLGSATPATNACTGGSSSGTMQYAASTWGPTDKKAIIRLNACVGSRTYTFPSGGYLVNAPGYFYSASITPANVSVSFSGTPATSVTVTTTAATTGVIVIEDVN